MQDRRVAHRHLSAFAFTASELAFILTQRVARLSTSDADGQPHAIPVCFAWHDDTFWIAIDEKPKRTMSLKRLRNIAENQRVALLFDRYADDWSSLAYVLVFGVAEVLPRGDAQPAALDELRERYPQYGDMGLEERPLIRISPERVVAWGLA